MTRRGSLLENDWQTTINLDVALRIPSDAFNASLRLSIFNLLNDKAVFDLLEVGTTGWGCTIPELRAAAAYQTQRYVRLQFGVNF